MTDPLEDIRHYSPTFTISQVVKFCEKKSLPISRAMIQNYIRDGLLPPPVNSRLYTQKHLAALVVICRLKNLYDMPAIKTAMAPHMDDEGLPLETYKWLLVKQKESRDLWLKNVAPSIVSQPEDSQALLIMSHVADIKGIEN